MTYEPRHLASTYAWERAATPPETRVEFWRALQDQNTLSRLGSRVMLRQAREPDLQPHNATEATP